MSEERSTRVVVRRSLKVDASQLNQSLVSETVEEAKLELISTQMLKQILCSSDHEDRNAVRDAANTPVDGVLARDTATGLFQIIADADFQTILDENEHLPKLSCPVDVTIEPLHDYADSENLSLVSTRALRSVFADDEIVEEVDPETEVDMCDFKPYECS